MNFYDHLKAINNAVDKFCRNERKPPLLLSLRYSQIMDNESITEIAYLAEHLEGQDIRVIFTGLHKRVIAQMEHIEYFSRIMKEENEGEKRMYKISI